MEEQREVFYEESNSIPYFITPVSVISFLFSPLTAYTLSPLLWSMILPANKTPPRSNVYFHTLLGSTLHAFVVSLLTIYLMVYGLMGTNRVWSKSPLGFATMQISFGYFVGDFIVSLLDPKLRSDSGMLVHHVAGMVGIGLSLFYQGKFMFFVVYRLIAECSTPFVNLRYVLANFGQKNGSLYASVGISMLASFILCRIIVIPWHWYEYSTTIVTEEAAVVVPLFFRLWLGGNYLVFDVLNIYWCYKIVKGMIKFFTKKST